MTSIAILGSGRVARPLAAALAAAGHRVTVGVRDPALVAEPVTRWAADAGVALTGHAGAARAADLVVNATPGDVSLRLLTGLADELAGKVLVDLANATVRGPAGLPAGLLYPDSSLAAEIQRALPQVRVVKTLNTMFFTVMTDPRSLTAPATAFLSGDDGAAKAATAELLTDLGWPAGWICDLGGIGTARATEATVLLVPHLIGAYGLVPFALAVAR